MLLWGAIAFSGGLVGVGGHTPENSEMEPSLWYCAIIGWLRYQD